MSEVILKYDGYLDNVSLNLEETFPLQMTLQKKFPLWN